VSFGPEKFRLEMWKLEYALTVKIESLARYDIPQDTL